MGQVERDRLFTGMCEDYPKENLTWRGDWRRRLKRVNRQIFFTNLFQPLCILTKTTIFLQNLWKILLASAIHRQQLLRSGSDVWSVKEFEKEQTNLSSILKKIGVCRIKVISCPVGFLRKSFFLPWSVRIGTILVPLFNLLILFSCSYSNRALNLLDDVNPVPPPLTILLVESTFPPSVPLLPLCQLLLFHLQGFFYFCFLCQGAVIEIQHNMSMNYENIERH